MLSFVVLGLSFVPFIASQSIGIASIEAHFKQAGLVPSLLEKFEPTSTLTVNFPGKILAVTPLQLLNDV
jgi:hypothetical protein